MELSRKGKNFLDTLDFAQKNFPIQKDAFSQFKFEGKSQEYILKELKKRLKKDLSYNSGKILGAMTTEPHDFANSVYSKYLSRNLGDRGLNPATAEIENDLIYLLGDLLGDHSVHGNLTSGGTEANIIAIFLAKQLNITVENPSIVIPKSAHYSFDKAAALMGIKVSRANILSDFSLDLEHYESLITDNTIALVAVAGTSSLGLIDPIKEIADLSKKYKKYLHVDAAFGGLVLPFMEMLGFNTPIFDFRLPEICSITVDPHKMGMNVNPAGCFLVRKSLIGKKGFEIPYLAGGSFKSMNILGTRPGAPAISFWALLHHLGKEGFMNIVLQCWENTIYLIKELSNIPEIELIREPQMNVIGIRIIDGLKINLAQFDSLLRDKGWALGYFKHFGLLRIVIMPHIKRNHIDNFIFDLKEIFKE